MLLVLWGGLYWAYASARDSVLGRAREVAGDRVNVLRETISLSMVLLKLCEQHAGLKNTARRCR